MTNDRIKNLVLIAIASDEQLLETLVLKGGNAIALLERGRKDSLSRTSHDLDYSMENDFDGDIEEYNLRIQRTLESTFGENGFVVFDYTFSVRPSKRNEKVGDFWGGYNIQFKIIEKEKFERFKDNPDSLRRNAVSILPNGSSKVEIEISKYEYVGKRMEVDVEGFVVYIYTPEMIVFEKLRAICQQLPQYADIVPSHSARPRARDFYDIYLISTLHDVRVRNSEDSDVLKAVFDAKKVPLGFINYIRDNSEIHRADWQNVKDTVSAKEEVRDFDFYLDYVLQTFGEVTSI